MKAIGLILEILGFFLIFTSIVMPFGNNISIAILGAVLVIYSISRKVISKIDSLKVV